MKSLFIKYILFIFLFSSAIFTYAQQAEYIFNADKSELSVLVNVNKAKLLAEDEYNKRRGLPLRIAKNYPLNLAIDTIGVWQTLSDSSKTWKFTVDVPGAVGLIVRFSDFYIPEGGYLYVYDKNGGINEESMVYTHDDNPRGGAYSLDVFGQDNVVFEYVAPAGSGILSRFTTKHIGYKYDGELPGFNNSNNGCMVNVNCSAAINWQKQKMGVMRLRVNATSGTYTCSGTLINNAKKDKTPYVLTAAHCFPNGTAADVDDTDFFFDYEFSGCSNSSIRPKYKYLNGADLMVWIPDNGGSDGALIKMKNNIPDEWTVYFNGWRLANTDGVIKDGTVIHHPAGDVKKISFYDNYLTSGQWTDTGGIAGIPSAHWLTKYSSGSTNKGSSGAPLFDETGLVVGTLTGGDAACNGKYTNNGTDYYGKMAYHWDKHPNVDLHMKKYLDPDNMGVMNIEGIFNKDDFEQELILSSSTAIVEENSTINILILQGNGEYKVTSGDPYIVTATIEEDKIIVYGNGVGNASLTVSDKLGKTAVIAVQVTEMVVTELKLEKSNVILSKNKSQKVAILSGNGDYQSEFSNSDIASANINGDIIEISPLNLGNTKLTISDRAKQKADVEIEVRFVVEIYAKNNSELYVKVNDDDDDEAIRFITISDLAGRVLYSLKNINKKEYTVDISGIKGGTYLVMVRTQKRKTETRKVAW